jgi:ubiquinone/menaquinone biosynthesis C-methylase UbiE
MAVPEYTPVLEDASRAEWQKPDEVVKELNPKPDEVIADIGVGTGYFARRLLRPGARFYGVDVSEELLERARANAPANFEPVLATPEDPRLPDGAIDTIFICNVLHHIGDRPAYYAKLARALKPGGRIVVIDFEKRELPVGPPVSAKLSDAEVIAELENAGFRLARRADILPYQYFLFFERLTPAT